ncbi:hypothetical protein FIU87_04835 [Bacillus sp. THAF10]|uniref:hypothetical protein n=1 Tax=Bacillus sp. THAF10 TaxID=2587848 RepID=UPI0012A828FA|nr:hypothetical protein [Bacillus sp. THAF10]QFT87975.1 hypothetical protein FIU87_04835 [Bacillus sp. THAF10]
MFKIFGFVIIFAIVFLLVTLNMGEQMGQKSVLQMGFSLVIGILLWVAMRVTDKS